MNFQTSIILTKQKALRSIYELNPLFPSPTPNALYASSKLHQNLLYSLSFEKDTLKARPNIIYRHYCNPFVHSDMLAATTYISSLDPNATIDCEKTLQYNIYQPLVFQSWKKRLWIDTLSTKK